MDVDFAVSLSLAKIVEDEASYGRLMSMLHARCALACPRLGPAPFRGVAGVATWPWPVVWSPARRHVLPSVSFPA